MSNHATKFTLFLVVIVLALVGSLRLGFSIRSSSQYEAHIAQSLTLLRNDLNETKGEHMLSADMLKKILKITMDSAVKQGENINLKFNLEQEQAYLDRDVAKEKPQGKLFSLKSLKLLL